jgi:hypothetical protein
MDVGTMTCIRKLQIHLVIFIKEKFKQTLKIEESSPKLILKTL